MVKTLTGATCPPWGSGPCPGQNGLLPAGAALPGFRTWSSRPQGGSQSSPSPRPCPPAAAAPGGHISPLPCSPFAQHIFMEHLLCAYLWSTYCVLGLL